MNELTQTLRSISALGGQFREAGTAKMSAPSRHLDLAYACDCTASMTWVIEAALDAIRSHMRNAASQVRLSVRMAVALYRDHDCRVPLNLFGSGSLTDGEFASSARLGELESFLQTEGGLEGNSTHVEALGAAIHYVSRLPWEAHSRALLHVGDHGSHGFNPVLANLAPSSPSYDSIDLCPLRMTHERILDALQAARIKCYMVRCGKDSDAERQYRAIAEATGGAFIDFDGLGGVDVFRDLHELVVEHASGGSIDDLLEKKGSSGRLTAPTARLLLESFEGRKR